MKRVYLDYAAATPVAPEVERVMRPYLGKIYGNPSSIHREGQEASAAVFLARQKIAKSLGCGYKEIIFTGSATEANNLALRGAVKYQISNIKYQNDILKFKIKYPRIIISAVEHESIDATARDLENEGVEVVRVPVSRKGIVDLDKLKAALNERTILVSIIYANNEVGVTQPIREIAKIINEFKETSAKEPLRQAQGINNYRLSEAQRSRRPTLYPLFHIDAAQAFQYLDCKPADLGIDLMTISSHKIYGPKGAGALYISDKRPATAEASAGRQATSDKVDRFIVPIITGADQEWNLRAGTENVPYIVGFGEAVALTDKLREKETVRVRKLRDYFWNKLKLVESKYPLSPPIGEDRGHFVELNGSLENRLPNNLNVYFPGAKAHDLLVALDMKGVAASAGSACHARVSAPSPIILALGYDEKRAAASLRFSLGRGTTKKEIDRVVGIIKKIY